MKVGKHYLGKMVEVVWMDPNYSRMDSMYIQRGRAALVTWKEYGIVYDVTDGVVLLVHSITSNNGMPGMDNHDEISRTALPESLIEAMTILTPAENPPAATPVS